MVNKYPTGANVLLVRDIYIGIIPYNNYEEQVLKYGVKCSVSKGSYLLDLIQETKSGIPFIIVQNKGD